MKREAPCRYQEFLILTCGFYVEAVLNGLVKKESEEELKNIKNHQGSDAKTFSYFEKVLEEELALKDLAIAKTLEQENKNYFWKLGVPDEAYPGVLNFWVLQQVAPYAYLTFGFTDDLGVQIKTKLKEARDIYKKCGSLGLPDYDIYAEFSENNLRPCFKKIEEKKDELMPAILFNKIQEIFTSTL